MQAFIRFIIRFHMFLLFLLVELIALGIVINGNSDRKAKAVSSANAIAGVFYSQLNVVTEYLSLRNTNKLLAEENARFSNLLKSSFKNNMVRRNEINDSTYRQQYFYFPAKVVNNSTNKNQNYITLDKGSEQGIGVDMAVVGPNGVVGIINSVSKNFSTAISILNTKLTISGRIKRNNYFGPVTWRGDDYRYVELNDLPSHISIQVGDTVVTSGYSTIFPEGLLIGLVKSHSIDKGSNFHRVTLELSTDFKSLSYVNIVSNLLKTEQETLEKQQNND